jgi:hypothetical protein
MRKAKLMICAVSLIAFVGLSVACGAFKAGMQAGKDAVSLQQIGTVYKNYCTTNKKGPADADELMKSATTQSEKDAVQEIKNGNLTAIWGVDVTDPKAGGNSSILAYTTNANNGVRAVLMADCTTVTSFQEADFQKHAKATPTTKGK